VQSALRCNVRGAPKADIGIDVHYRHSDPKSAARQGSRSYKQLRRECEALFPLMQRPMMR